MIYLSQLTGLRGLAAWWIVVFHFREALPILQDSWFSQFIAQGYLAVDFFFVLSGFIIFINYSRAFTDFNKTILFEFIVKRIARIYPLHLFILLLFLINPIALSLGSTSGIVGSQYDPAYFLASLLLVQNWGLFNDLAWNIPAWSISTEFGAYLTFPLLVLLINHSRQTLLTQILMVMSLCAGIAALFISCGYNSLGSGIAQIGLARCILEFAIGAVVGNIFLIYKDNLLAYKKHLALFLFTSLLSAYALNVPEYATWPFAFALLVLLFAIPSAWPSHLLGRGVLLYLGEISYSTYLVHYFVKDWVKFLSSEVSWFQFTAYVALVLLSSIFLYRYIEVPGRKWLVKKAIN